jgi:hypothetical protein
LPELVDRSAALLAEDPSREPERFARALVEIGTEIAERSVSLEKADIQAALLAALPPAEAAARSKRPGGQPPPAAIDDDDDEEIDEAESESASKGPGTDALRDGLKLSFAILAAVLRDALVHRSLSACGAAPARTQELRLLSPKLGVVQKLAEADEDRLAGRIQAISSAEWMLDRNVAPPLTCERLAIALGDRLVDFSP